MEGGLPMARRPKYMDRVEFWDLDEPGAIIVTLHYGWSFEPHCHEGVKGFDTAREAKIDIRAASRCYCDECRREIAKREGADHD